MCFSLLRDTFFLGIADLVSSARIAVQRFLDEKIVVNDKWKGEEEAQLVAIEAITMVH
jgi:hypothetical protein